MITITATTTELEWLGDAAPDLVVIAQEPFLTGGGVPVLVQGVARRAACTLGSGKVVIPQVQLPATEDSPDRPTAQYVAYLEGEFDGRLRSVPYSVFGNGFGLAVSPTTQTWEEIRENALGGFVSTASDKSVGGSLSVGEDLDVGGDLTVGGSGTFGGPVTATQFNGGGAGLTGVIAAGVGGTSSTGSLSIVADSDNTNAGELIDEYFGSGGGQTLVSRVSRLLRTFYTAVVGIFLDKGGQVHNVKAYGAVGDGTADDTAAINAAIAALQTGDTIYFPPSAGYKITASLTTLTKAVTIKMRGKVKPTTAVTGDVWTFSPPALGTTNYPNNEDNRFLNLDGLKIVPHTSADWRSAFVIDLSTLGQNLHSFRLKGCHLVGGSTGHALHVNNGNGVGSYRNQDGIFAGHIGPNNIFESSAGNAAFKGDYLGDSIAIHGDNIFRGAGMDLDLTFVPGATTLSVSGSNNFTSKGGSRIMGVYRFLWDTNISETVQASSTGVGGGLLYVGGGTLGGVITNSQFNSINGNTLNGVVLDGDTTVVVRDNNCNVPSGKFGVVATVNSINPIFGLNPTSGGGSPLSNSSTSAVFLPYTTVSRVGNFAGHMGVDNFYTNGVFQAAGSSATPSFPASGAGLAVTHETDGRVVAGAYSGSGGSGVTHLYSYDFTAIAPRDLYVLAAGILFETANGVSIGSGGTAVKKITHGVATLAAGVVVVSAPQVTTNSRIKLTAQDNSSTGALRVSARTAGVGFTITSSIGGDSGVVMWEITEPA